MTRVSLQLGLRAPRARRTLGDGAAERPFVVAHYPVWSGNPYLRLFYDALRPHGIIARKDAIFSPRWVWNEAEALDAIHIHWPEILWNGRKETVLRSIAKFILVLVVARFRGLRVIWTVHNVDPHESPARAERMALRRLARTADLLICHSASAAAEVTERYAPSGSVVTMPHGNYDDVYRYADVSTLEARQAFSLDPDRPVVACVGRLRSYKGLDEACEAAQRLAGKATLLIAGAPHEGFDIDGLSERVSEVPGAVLVPRALTDAEVALAIRSADLVLLPYWRITGSGSLLAAWTLGRAVVASRLPYFEELVGDSGGAGWLYPSGDPEALVDAVRRGLETPASQREAAARAQADRYDWGRVVGPVVDAIGRWRRNVPDDQVGTVERVQG